MILNLVFPSSKEGISKYIQPIINAKQECLLTVKYNGNPVVLVQLYQSSSDFDFFFSP